MMAWAMIPVAFCLQAAGRRLLTDALARGLALAGLAVHQLVHGVFPELPEEATNPLMDAVLPAASGLYVSPNLATGILGWQGLKSLLPLFGLTLLAGAAILRGGPAARTREQSWGRVLVALVPMLLLALLVLLNGPGWTNPEMEAFLRWLARLGRSEAAI
jgi:hypothetical protein